MQDRAELAYFLIETLDSTADQATEDALLAELTRRAEDVKNGAAVGIPAAEVLAELHKELS